MVSNWHNEIPERYLLRKKQNSVHVDLGCGGSPRNPLGAKEVVGLDVFKQPPYLVSPKSLDYKQVFPGRQLPFEADQIDSVSAFDFLEHIPRVDRSSEGEFRNPFIDMMNEIHRILRPGGLLIALTPCFPSPAAFTDPTHVNFISEETHLYFSGPNYANAKGYGFTGEFKLIEAGWSDWKGHLWDTFAIKDLENLKLRSKEPRKRSQESRMRIKLKLRKSILGHSGETHFLWVFQKPENSK